MLQFKCSFSTVFILLTLLLAGGCTPTAQISGPATLGYVGPSYRDLISLPPPKGKIMVSVYSFRDQSGQYKYHPAGSTFSTAITQGASAMLIQALKSSGWFMPVEREGLNDLLTERKILGAKTEAGDQLSKLTPAPLIMGGGIIAYETNVMTGGFGAKYFGLGGMGEYRRDQVALNLRTIDVNTGVIIHSVNTTKTILSRQVDFNLFRFVSYQRLLEVETGLSTNEPPQLCVMEAIEKAVVGIVVEGILAGSWALADPEDIKAPVIQNYLEERERLQPSQMPQDHGQIDQADSTPAAS